MVKEIIRTKEQKEYRNKLAVTLRNLRTLWRKDLAENLLEWEKNKDIYKDSEKKRVEVQIGIRWLDKAELDEVLNKIEEIKNRKNSNEQAKPEQAKPEQAKSDQEEIEWTTTFICPVCWETDHEPGAKFCHNCWIGFENNENNNKDEEKEWKIVFKCPNCWETDHEPGASYCHACWYSFESGQSLIDFD